MSLFKWIKRETTRAIDKQNLKLKTRNSKSKLNPNVLCPHKVKRIAFYVGCPDNRSERYRVENIVTALTSENVIVDKYYEGNAVELTQNTNYDLLIVFRAHLKMKYLSAIIDVFKSKNIPLVYDSDDLIFRSDLIDRFAILENKDAKKVERFKSNLELYKETIQKFNFATVTTDFLKTEFQNAGIQNTFVIKNTINKAQFDLAQKLNKTKNFDNKVIKISYLSGTATHNIDFKEVETALLQIFNEYENVEFHVVGYLEMSPPFKKFKNRIKFKPYMNYLKLLEYSSKMDINIAPLEMNNPLNDSKSELKIFESALVKVPSVVSAIDSYSKCVNNDINGFLARNEQDWYKYLSPLVSDSNERKKIAQKAYNDFVSDFYIENQTQNIINIYESILEKAKLVD